MASIKDKEKSLLEVSVELLKSKHTPQKIKKIVEETMQKKGKSVSESKRLTPQFLADFMESGYFVYCGDDCWDLKERQPISVIDKDGGDFDDIFFGDDVKNAELKDDNSDSFLEPKYGSSDIDDEEDDVEDDDDDLSREFEDLENADEGIQEVYVDEENSEEEIDEEELDEVDLSEDFK